MKQRISNSAMDAYNRCPRFYKFRYIENVKGDYTATPLLFGSAIDAALNYILESIRDNKEWTKQQAEGLFLEYMNKWPGNRLEYFKNEIPESAVGIGYTDVEMERIVFNTIILRGLACIEVYINDFLPLLDSVISVQNRGVVLNEEGDEFTFVVDFIGKLKDGRTVLFDNKTASAKYKKKAVVESQQLSLYIEQFPEIILAGYIVLIKNPEREKGMKLQILIDEIPEETRAKSFKLLDETMQNIKAGKFDCNFKGCMAFGKKCEYERACSYGDYTGLVPAREKKDESTGSAKNPE